MSKKLANLLTAYYIFIGRSFVVILGCIAIVWGIIVLPVFWQESSTERIAGLVIAGDPFKPEILAQQLPIIDRIEKSGHCRPAALRSAAIIRLRMAETEMSNNGRKQIGGHLKPLSSVFRSSLSCAPADPFLWLVLYWVKFAQNGVQSEDLQYLRMSYWLGPNEGWIALKRNPVAFSIFQKLPPDLAATTINEFDGLLKSKFYDEAAKIFVGPAWPERELVLSQLSRVALQDRQQFSAVLYSRGYDVNIPGIASRDLYLRH
jgi:hypothetical protein